MGRRMGRRQRSITFSWVAYRPGHRLSHSWATRGVEGIEVQTGMRGQTMMEGRDSAGMGSTIMRVLAP